MKKDSLVYAHHILDSILRMEDYLQGSEYEDFIENTLLQAGVIREIEVIGEATKRLSDDIRKKYPDIPWRRMAGMRDKLIHDYMGIDVDAVWETVEKDIPHLKIAIQKVIEQEGPK